MESSHSIISEHLRSPLAETALSKAASSSYFPPCSISVILTAFDGRHSSFLNFLCNAFTASADGGFILNYAGLFAGSVFFLYQYTFVLNRPVSSLALILAGLTLLLSKALHLYGSGDGEIFGVVSVFILAGNSSLDSIFYLYMMYMVALLLITLTHLKDIDWENMRFKQPLPFAPSIFAATVLTLLVM